MLPLRVQGCARPQLPLPMMTIIDHFPSLIRYRTFRPNPPVLFMSKLNLASFYPPGAPPHDCNRPSVSLIRSDLPLSFICR